MSCSKKKSQPDAGSLPQARSEPPPKKDAALTVPSGIELLPVPSGVHEMAGRKMGPIPDIGDPYFIPPQAGPLLAILWFGAGQPYPVLRASVERVPPDHYNRLAYYERFAVAIEGMVIEAGYVTRDEIDKRAKALLSGSRKMDPRRIPPRPAKDRWAKPSRPVPKPNPARPEKPTRFKVGDKVTAKTERAKGHTRLPAYARGKTGQIVSIDQEAVEFEDIDETGEWVDPSREALYKVRFSSQGLWGKAADPNSSVFVDLWDSHLM